MAADIAVRNSQHLEFPSDIPPYKQVLWKMSPMYYNKSMWGHTVSVGCLYEQVCLWIWWGICEIKNVSFYIGRFQAREFFYNLYTKFKFSLIHLNDKWHDQLSLKLLSSKLKLPIMVFSTGYTQQVQDFIWWNHQRLVPCKSVSISFFVIYICVYWCI